MSINLIALSGFVGGDPTEKFFNDGVDMVTDISVALNPGFEHPTLWLNCRFRSKVSNDANRRSIAERVFEDIKKGDLVYIQGRMDTYTTEEGDKKRVVPYVEALSYEKLVKPEPKVKKASDEIPV